MSRLPLDRRGPSDLDRSLRMHEIMRLEWVTFRANYKAFVCAGRGCRAASLGTVLAVKRVHTHTHTRPLAELMLDHFFWPPTQHD